MKIIFLDVDGVLNKFGTYGAWSADIQASNYTPQLEPANVIAFNQIVVATGAKIVLSSSWRHFVHNGHMDLYGFQVLLQSHGVKGRLIDVTRPEADVDDQWEPRWQQIADWLKNPMSFWDDPEGKKVAVDGYCILDDNPEAFGGRPGIQTNGAIGLTLENAVDAIEILGAEHDKAA
jgi:hypothetical protein